ncbi:MAG: hypothetical protein HYY40_11200 [Bacteroidetes bacterium]|nr:hypothetical protein [Bacteroidota bacterium]
MLYRSVSTKSFSISIEKYTMNYLFPYLLFFIWFSCRTANKPRQEPVSPDKFTMAEPDTSKQGTTATQSGTTGEKPRPHPVPVNVNVNVNPPPPVIQATADSVFATLERTPCYGRCPNYKITIYKSGYTLYEGKRFTDRIGLFTCFLTRQEMGNILERAKSINYFNLQDVYDSQVTDLPSVITSIREGNRVKTVKARFNVPPALRNFEQYFDSIFENKTWTPMAQH